MLVLSRKKEEQIRIGDDIKILVVEIRGDKVRLGIDAPRHIDVHREEIWLMVQDEAIAGKRVAADGEVDASSEAGANDSPGVVR